MSSELAEEPGLVQEASYIISVKNPQVGGPQAAGPPGEDEVEFPTYLLDVFQGHRFANVDPPDFLDHEGTEFVLISASGDIGKELGIELDTEKETLETAELFKSLKMDKDKKPEPLLPRAIGGKGPAGIMKKQVGLVRLQMTRAAAVYFGLCSW